MKKKTPTPKEINEFFDTQRNNIPAEFYNHIQFPKDKAAPETNTVNALDYAWRPLYNSVNSIYHVISSSYIINSNIDVKMNNSWSEKIIEINKYGDRINEISMMSIYGGEVQRVTAGVLLDDGRLVVCASVKEFNGSGHENSIKVDFYELIPIKDLSSENQKKITNWRAGIYE